MPEDQPKTIDERLEAITHSLELLTHDVHAMQNTQSAMIDSQTRLDARERQLREAILRGLYAFIQGLGNGTEGQQP